MHVNLLCACSHLEAMKGSSSLTSCRLLILSRLSSSLIWAQLTLLVPAWGTRSPSLQDGAPIHRVRAHSLTGIRNSYHIWQLGILSKVEGSLFQCPHLRMLRDLWTNSNMSSLQKVTKWLGSPPCLNSHWPDSLRNRSSKDFLWRRHFYFTHKTSLYSFTW
jgi:hypothetical protein